eukprot:TRINITY_DN4174_c0_g1_i1.p1 TRINITY_DN4174_c0_g1~~TRINITY_DN4174_c0_g1_i1.p1  ORF type:complete len:154 (-),score=21.40 TRINITY_DN4174_c0_g1_i1:44-505(-)
MPRIGTKEPEDLDTSEEESEESEDEEISPKRKRSGRLGNGLSLLKNNREERSDDLQQAQETGITRLLKSELFRTAVIAIGLLLVGLIFLSAAIAMFVKAQATKAAALIVTGILCFLPGAYQTYVLYRIAKRSPGYQFSQVPSGEGNLDEDDES